MPPWTRWNTSGSTGAGLDPRSWGTGRDSPFCPRRSEVLAVRADVAGFPHLLVGKRVAGLVAVPSVGTVAVDVTVWLEEHPLVAVLVVRHGFQPAAEVEGED